MSVSKVADSVYLIDTLAYNERQAVACYLVRSRDKIAIIDTGYASTYLNVLIALAHLRITPERVNYIIPTHVHLDHSGATGHLAEIMKNAKIIAHEKAFKHLVDPTRLVESAKTIFGEEKVKYFGIPKPIEAERIEVVKDELEINMGDLTLTCIYAPGHAPHQISVLVREKNILITADSVGIIYPILGYMIPTTPPPQFDPEQAINTVENLSSFNPKTLLLPHFGLRDDPSRVFEETKLKINQWIEEVRNLSKETKDPNLIASKLAKKVANESGFSEEALPYYAKQSIYVSVLGILNYLSKKSALEG